MCKRISITFDPFLMATLPIPDIKILEIKAFFINYKIDGDYQNYLLKIKINSQDRVADFRKKVEEKYGFDPSSYLITNVADNRVINMYNNQQIVSEMSVRNGIILMYVINPALNPQLPPIEKIKKDDSHHGIDPTWTKLCINMYQGSQGLLNLPRFIHVEKSSTLKDLHHQIFDYFKHLLLNWIT